MELASKVFKNVGHAQVEDTFFVSDVGEQGGST
jgi:hypothetical protein